MKKIAILLLAMMMVFALAACGDNDSPDPSGSGTGQQGEQTQGGTENSGDTAPDIDFGSIMTGNGATDTVWGQQDAAARQAILDAAKEDGYDASFGADGSLTIKDPESGETYVQKPDGTWTFQSEDGGEGQLGGNWPDNDFTKLVPKPGFALMAANTDDMGFSVAFSDATIEQMRDYAEQVKAAGFNQNITTEDQEVMGMVIFNFSASNADGYTVEVFSASGTSGMNITAP